MTKKKYATCDCGREMEIGGACTLTHIKTPQGKYLPRIPHGQESRFGDMDEIFSKAVSGKQEPPHCHDCNAAVGAIHHIGCDWEECPVCHGQAMGCEHIESFVAFEQPKFTPTARPGEPTATDGGTNPRVNLELSKGDAELIDRIVKRFMAVSDSYGFDPLSVHMDIAACHLNAYPLRLEDMVKGRLQDLVHDVTGIMKHLNRETGKLEGKFIPRYAVKQ